MTAPNEIGGFNIAPYSQDDRDCPKCEGSGVVDRFATASSYVRGNGQLHDVSGGPGLVEHLVVRCLRCGWEWLMATRDAE